MKHTDLQRLTDIVQDQGRRLLALQPRRALADFDSMQQHFEQSSAAAYLQIQQALSAHWPDIAFARTAVDPTQQDTPDQASYWICDPIDGAVQYLAGLALWTVTICLMVDQQPVMAVVYEPVTGRTYRALAGAGAECDGAPLRCASRSEIALATLGTSFPNHPPRPQSEVDQFLVHLARTIPRVFAQRWMGPASLLLAQVGAGILDGYWETGRSVVDWLPGALIAREAGARISALDGGEFGWSGHGILAASAAMYPALNAVLNPPDERA